MFISEWDEPLELGRPDTDVDDDVDMDVDVEPNADDDDDEEGNGNGDGDVERVRDIGDVRLVNNNGAPFDMVDIVDGV